MNITEAQRLFSYDPISGNVVLLIGNRKTRAGSIVGTKSDRGHLICWAYNKLHKVHRVAWLLHYGVWPSEDIDHANGNPADNRITNLRLATDSQNLGNMCKPVTNMSGKKGVSWHAGGKKWQAHIKVGGVNFYLGLFETVEEAHAAYMAKAVECRGEFARAG